MNRLIVLATAGLIAGAAPPANGASLADTFITSTLHLTRYKTAFVDLNSDGVSEMLVYAYGPEDCGSGGCSLYVLAQQAGTYRVVTTVSVTRPPIRVSSTTSYGWRDLSVHVAGGGVGQEYDA